MRAALVFSQRALVVTPDEGVAGLVTRPLWVFGGLFFALRQSLPCWGWVWVCTLVVGEARRVRLNEAPLPLNVCAVPKEPSAEAGEAPAVTADVRTACVGVPGSAQKLPEVMPHSPLSSPQVCSWAGTGAWGLVTTGIEGVVPAVRDLGLLCGRAPQGLSPSAGSMLWYRDWDRSPRVPVPGAVCRDERFSSAVQHPCAQSGPPRFSFSTETESKDVCGERFVSRN